MRKHILLVLLIVFVILLFTGCISGFPGGNSSGNQTSQSAAISSAATSSTGTSPTASPTGKIVTPALTIPKALIKTSALNSTKYVVFAWNDLGMHCANPTYDTAVLLPPYNNIITQVIERGNPPKIVTSGLSVEYKFINNTYSYGKGAFGQFWDNVKKLFGADLAKDTGLNLVDPDVHNGLSGTMLAKEGFFEATGIPLTQINDDGTWNPYQVAQITVKNSTGIVAQTYATAPVSTEINCAKCHGTDPFQDVLEKHDKSNGTKLVDQKPVLCAGCHGDPILGAKNTGSSLYLSQSIHGFHAGVSPQPDCYDCHPGNATKCSRSLAHTAADGGCISCHGDLAKVSGSISSSGRVPWENEPQCITCHSGIAEVDTGETLYRNATGHGGVYCTSCHSSPHAMIPTSIASDNYQALQYQGAAKTIGSCGACHDNSRGEEEEPEEFMETHGGLNPKDPNACNLCHTSTPSNTAQWPHAFQWKATQGAGNVDDD